jgi:hypothetical protein
MSFIELLRGKEPEPEPVISQDKNTIGFYQEQCRLKQQEAKDACEKLKALRKELACEYTTADMILNYLDKQYEEQSARSGYSSHASLRMACISELRAAIRNGDLLPEDLSTIVYNK